MNSRGPQAASGCAGENRSGKPMLQLHYSAKTHSTFIIHFISARARSSFAQGQPKEKKQFLSSPSKEINAPDKVGILSFGCVEHKYTPDNSEKHSKSVLFLEEAP